MTVQKHSELLCRDMGLRKVAALAVPAEIGGLDFSYHAVRELKRILALSERDVHHVQNSSYRHY